MGPENDKQDGGVPSDGTKTRRGRPSKTQSRTEIPSGEGSNGTASISSHTDLTFNYPSGSDDAEEQKVCQDCKDDRLLSCFNARRLGAVSTIVFRVWGRRKRNTTFN